MLRGKRDKRVERDGERKRKREMRERETISKWAVALLWVVLRYIRKLGGRGGLLS